MTEAAYKKKLIEVALPLDVINAESAREKAIRHGHPATMHLWWARRPLAACRAVLFGQLVDDPSAHPDHFPTEADQDRERQRLFGVIEALVKWENSTNEEVLQAARSEILRSCGTNPPPILDPFAGGGSIPLEAQRLGLEAHASDLNPVAVLINKALIEIPPRWADQPPVHPHAENRTRWKAAEGLAEDVRRYGMALRDEAYRRVGHLYPKATLSDGTKASVIAWIWARTVTCPNPPCGATMPLASSFWLGKKKGKEAWINPHVERGSVRFAIGKGPGGPPNPPKVGRGAKFECMVCGETADDAYTHDEIDGGRSSAVLMAMAADGHRQRLYIAPETEQVEAAQVARPANPPSAEGRGTFGGNAQGKRYGFKTFGDYFTNRQLTTLLTCTELISLARSRIQADAEARGLSVSDSGEYAIAISTYLAAGISKVVDYGNSLCGWASHPKQEAVRNAFSRQAISMTWDFAEANPFNSTAGSLGESFEWVAKAVERLPAGRAGYAVMKDARTVGSGAVIATDPPYYDNIGYADLSDFFYVWLRLSLRDVYPDLFHTVLTPKTMELIASRYRHSGSKEAADYYFEHGFVDVFERCRGISPTDIPMTLFYAFKQSETEEDGGLASTGWSTMLEGLASAGWMVTATWPIRTEMANKIGMKANMLASSVAIACRPRPKTAGVTDRRGLIRSLQEELPRPLRELQKAHIAPVDLRQAAIGPGMAVFSRFAKVIEPDGSTMRVRTALGLINQVLSKVLDEQEEEFDGETRWAVQWFSQFYADQGPYGVAEQLAVSMNVAVRKMVESGILASGGGKVHLLSRDELPDEWDPRVDVRTTVWEATQHLVKQLESGGEAPTGRLLRLLGGLGESAQLLAYRLYTVCEKARPALAGPYNALVASWPEIQRHSRDPSELAPASVDADRPRLDL